MRVVEQLPQGVETVEHLLIPMADGAQLAARLWLPENADRVPVPAILEYIPYRKRDLTRDRDDINHAYFAGHGYACLRVDLRGSGESDGVLTDEYTETELADAEAVIAWLAEQPWCNGRVGMMGISWGGFNSLQLAARRPPALRAIISDCASDDIYSDNMHYMGGCLLGDHLSEATAMFAFNSLPPDPALVGERWRPMWFNRLQGSGLWLEKWLRPQRRNDYWKRASVCEDYAAVGCPVLAVGGWADGYTNAIFRLMEHLEVPRKALIGPWGHRYPHLGIPGPTVGFLQEALRWWDYWLKDQATGIMNEPMLQVWMQDSVPPSTSYQDRPGRWVAEPCWPSPRIRTLRYTLDDQRLVEGDPPLPEKVYSVRSPLSVGLYAGKWCSYSAVPDLPYDQREEDGGALVFESEPLAEPLEILGRPEVQLTLAADKPVAMVAVRLSDVLPDGRATRVTYGLLNLTHRDGHEHPEPLEPSQRYDVTVQLNGIAQRFPRGHRLRISISTSYWPLAWPPPEPVSISVSGSLSKLLLPCRPLSVPDDAHALGAAEGAQPLVTDLLEPGRHAWRVIRELASDTATLEVVNDQGRFRIPEIDLEVRRSTEEWYSYHADDFTSLRGETVTERAFRRGDWDVRAETHTVLSCDHQNFMIHARLDAFEGERRVYSYNWDERIPRDLM